MKEDFSSPSRSHLFLLLWLLFLYIIVIMYIRYSTSRANIFYPLKTMSYNICSMGFGRLVKWLLPFNSCFVT